MSKTGTRKPNGSGTVRADGYVQIRAEGHPVAGANGLAFQHRVVLYDAIGPGTHECHYCGTPVTWFSGLETDHKDHDKQNNAVENLVPCCMTCNRTRWNTQKDGCPHNHGPYDKQYANGHRYCSKCKSEKEKRRRAKRKLELNV